jgi:hypothetical protein
MNRAFRPEGIAPARPEIVLLARSAIRARRRPGAVLVVWAWEALLGLAISWPIASVAHRVYGSHPDGDAPVFRAGGLELLDLLAHSMAAGGPIACAVILVVLAASVAGLFPSAMLLASMTFVTRARTPPPLRAAMARASTAFAPSVTALLATRALQGVLLAVGLSLAKAASTLAVARLGEAAGDKALLAVVLPFVLVCGVAGIVGDLARATVIRFDARGGDALRVAARVFARAPLEVTWSYVWRTISGCVPLVFGALVAARIGGRAGVPLLALFVVHQSVTLVRVALQASWMASAVRALD